MRAPDGTITEYDVPGAGTGPFQGTFNYGITPAGATSGAYADSNNVQHGYVRAPDGAITKYDVPGAGTDAGQGTLGGCINHAGTIVGDSLDANNVFHSYVRFRDGAVTTVDVPGAGTGQYQGTSASCNNSRNAITGWYTDASNVNHGFLLLPSSEGDANFELGNSATPVETAPATESPSTVVPIKPALGIRVPRWGRGSGN